MKIDISKKNSLILNAMLLLIYLIQYAVGCDKKKKKKKKIFFFFLFYIVYIE